MFNLGGLGEMELLMEEVVDGGGVHAGQNGSVDRSRDIAWVLMWGRRISHGAACFVHVNECTNGSHVVVA